MASIPKDPRFDSSLSLLADGYTFLQKRHQRYNSDIFELRLMLEKTVSLHGKEAAAVFYDDERFKRKGATPKRVQKTLFGEKGVQTLDDQAHRHRKSAFMSLMTRDNIQQLMDLISDYWKLYIRKWETVDSLTIYDEVQEMLCRAACRWSGVPLAEAEVKDRAKDFGLRVDAFGAVGPRHWRGRLARQRTENWIERIIEQIRNGELETEEGTAAHVFAWHRDLEGKLLSRHVAAVELINVIRPIVAIAIYATFCALAMHRYPEQRKKLREADAHYAELFVQEVRRYYPFAPFLGARVRKDFEWMGYQFKKGRLVLLDVYGTLRDPRYWEHPEQFWPERFQDWSGSPYDFMPQGGGDYLGGHRCAGEWVTIEAMKICVLYMAKGMNYEVPEQDLNFSLSRMPTRPRSGFIISNVRARDIEKMERMKASMATKYPPTHS